MTVEEQLEIVLQRLAFLEAKTSGISKTPPRTDWNGGDVRITPGRGDREQDPSATDGKIYLVNADGSQQVVFDFDECVFKHAGAAPPRKGFIMEGVDTVGTEVSGR
jgi:hypothetical protein